MLGMLLAVALQTSSTNCYPIGLGNVHCDTNTSQPQAAPPQRGFNSMEGLNAFQMGREARRQEEAAPPRYESAPPHAPIFGQNAANVIFADELSRRVAAYIRQRRCQEAYDLASLAGEQEMAARVPALCSSAE
jgi:hypothetical protein